MGNDSIRKIAVIGPPGSGKSTFAARLGERLNLPVHHLDLYQFQSDGSKTDLQEFFKIQQDLMQKDCWIIEGCSSKTFESRFIAADVVIYLNFSRLSCIWRVLKRVVFEKDLARTGCADFVNWELLQYIWAFSKEKDPLIKALVEKYPNLYVEVLRNRTDVEKFHSKLNNKERRLIE